MLDQSAVLGQIDTLLNEYRQMEAASIYDDLSDLKSGVEQLVVRCQAAVDRLTVRTGSHRAEADATKAHAAIQRLPLLIGVLAAMRADIEAGWLVSVEEVLHAETFADFIEMARELHSKGYKDAAAVIAGSVLEAHLRLLCAKVGASPSSPGGTPKKAEAMNSELAGANVYNKLQQKQVTAHLGLRNSAAHGEYGNYQAADVANMIAGVEQFILTNPA